jgi:carbonic anhydrase/acetyltransferase-like protein (isoleucine patch superfamily)
MATIIELGGVRPTIGQDVYLAPTAVLVGDVHIGDRASIWFGAVLRGDSDAIHVGAGTSVQDNAVIHCAKGRPTVIGENVVVGHAAMLEGCVVEDGAVIGMGSICLQRSRVGRRAMLAAGAVLGEGKEVGAEMLAAGVPAVEKKQLSGSALGWADHAAEEYQRYRERYLTTSKID